MKHASPSHCVYMHGKQNIRAVVHVNYFLVTGEAPELEWLEIESKQVLSIKSEEIGAGPRCAKEVKFLNRTVRWTSTGLEIEGDLKHVGILMSEWGMAQSKVASTPGSKAPKPEEQIKEEDKPEMEPTEATKFRRGVARVVYMAQDRLDLGYASKELAKNMARPRLGDEVALKRTIRYLKGRPRGVYIYPWQDPLWQ